MLPYLQRPDSHGSTRKNEVTRFKHKELTYVTYQFIHSKEHIYRMALLHSASINIKMKTDVLHMSKAFHRHKIPQYSRTIETLTQLPWQSLTTITLLQITRCDIHTYGNGIVVTMSKARSYILTQLTDAYHQLGLVFKSLGKVGDKEGLATLQESRIGLHEYHWTFRFSSRAIQLFAMLGIVHAYADYLHKNIGL